MAKIILALAIIFFVFTGISFAQEKSPTPTANPTPTPAFVKYDLAYPGMLPDSPFYKIKVLRDKITLAITKDPIKKAERHLLLADKRIYMAKMLFDKNEIELAKETALKGENEYTLLVNTLKDARKKPSKELFEKLEKASMKHQEILNEIASKTDGENKKTFQIVIEFSKINLEELKKIYKNY